MKKWCLMVLAALCLLIPTVGSAQGLPDFLQAVQTGLSEGLSAGSAAMEKDLTLSVTASDARVEAGRDVTLTIRAENPRPAETRVALTLSLPERLAAQANEALAWEAALPAAEMDEMGALVPSVTTFTRTLTLMPGGESAQGTVTAEMSVGSRFYRQSLPIALCVADISAKTSVTGAENGRLTAGKTMAYAVEIANAGTAEKTVPVELILPADVTLSGDLPEGFTRSQRQIRGEVKAAAAAGDEPFTTTLVFPMTVNEDALDGDEDAMRLLLDGKHPEILLTDPPYCSGGFQESGKSVGSIGTKQSDGNGGQKTPTISSDNLSTRGYQTLMRAVLSATDIKVAYIFTDWRMWLYLWDLVEASGLAIRNMIVWNKKTPGMGNGWRAQHELVMFAHRTKPAWDNHKGYGNVIEATRSGNELHPTQKPVEILEKLLDNTQWAEGVLDTFGGSGTTLIAAESVGQPAYVMEMEPAFVDVIVKRYIKTTGKTTGIRLFRKGKELGREHFERMFTE